MELMEELGFDALGIDLDDGTLHLSHNTNKGAQPFEVIAYLKSLPESSVCVVSGFYAAEHLQFEVLHQFVEESFRVLLPGGMLILEISNLGNICLGTNSLNTDIDTQRAIPLEVIFFLMNCQGFIKTKKLSSQQSISLQDENDKTRLDFGVGVYIDYAVVGQKSGGPKDVELLIQNSKKDYGIKLSQLLKYYQKYAKTCCNPDENKLQEARFKLKVTELRAEFLERKIEMTERNVQALDTTLHKSDKYIQSMLNSRSWRITSPLRWILDQLRRLRNEGFKKYFVKTLKQAVRDLVPFVVRHPMLRLLISRITTKLGVKKKLKSLIRLFPKKQLFVDVSSIVEYDHQTGIQRVIKCLLVEFLKNPPPEFVIEPVYATHNLSYRYAKKYKASLEQVAIESGDDNPITYEMDDVFLGLDLNHYLPIVHEKNFHEMLANGVGVYFLVYDLLPIQFPHFWDVKNSITEAHKNLLSVISKLSGAVCISRTVANELSDWINECSIHKNPLFKISSFHLGADFKRHYTNLKRTTDYNDIIFESNESPIFLMIGTIEPRKGHDQVISAFEYLWSKDISVNLLIIGKKGWLVDDLISRIVTHVEIGKKLIWLDNVSDTKLEELYLKSSCLIAASYGEGFGLPLIEAAQHKLPIIARDIPVFREVAGDYAYYFETNSPSCLADAIKKWLYIYSTDKHPKSDNLPWLSWAQSAQQLFKALGVKYSQ
jgi:glycosyltransferase involved in cell wall biosynthesis